MNEPLGAKVDSSVPRFRYEKVAIKSIYDADTLTLEVDLGFTIHFELRTRLARVNAWELRGPEKDKGRLARHWLSVELSKARSAGEKIWIETFEDAKGKFGRYLIELYIGDRNMNNELVENGHGKFQEY